MNWLDLSSYTSADLTFDWLIESSFDGGEYLALDFYDGSNWNEILRLDGNVDPENTWHSRFAKSLHKTDSRYNHGRINSHRRVGLNPS